MDILVGLFYGANKTNVWKITSNEIMK
jgi:hypothetical protein